MCSGSDSLGRVMGAMKMLERRQVLPDTFLLNQLMRAYTLLEQYDKAEDVFYRVMKAGGASQAEAKARPCAPDVVSWNIMIDGYARQGKPALARRCFREMLEQPHESIQPDKFTYTALLKSYVMVDDFAALGWSPEGRVYFSYAVVVSADSTGYTADAAADLDENGVVQIWGYKKAAGDGSFVNGGLGCDHNSLIDEVLGSCISSASVY